MPKRPALRVASTRLAHGSYRLRVTASVAGVGTAEAQTDTEPVTTRRSGWGPGPFTRPPPGLAGVAVTHGERVKVTAGDTLVPTSIYLKGARQ